MCLREAQRLGQELRLHLVQVAQGSHKFNHRMELELVSIKILQKKIC
jgi:hypothetical protein